MTASQRAARFFSRRTGWKTDILKTGVICKGSLSSVRGGFSFSFWKPWNILRAAGTSSVRSHIQGIGGISQCWSSQQNNDRSIWICWIPSQWWHKWVSVKQRCCTSTLFCLTLHSLSCLFLLLTTKLLAPSPPTGRKTVFAWRERSVKLNNGSSGEIWQQRLTFGTPALSPPAYLRKQVASCTPSGRGVPEKQKCGRIWRTPGALRINEAASSLWGSWEEGWAGAWPAAESPRRSLCEDRRDLCPPMSSTCTGEGNLFKIIFVQVLLLNVISC